LASRCKPLSGCSSAGSLAGLPNGSGSSTNSPTSASKQKVNRKASPLEIIGKSTTVESLQIEDAIKKPLLQFKETNTVSIELY